MPETVSQSRRTPHCVNLRTHTVNQTSVSFSVEAGFATDPSEQKNQQKNDWSLTTAVS